LLFNLLLLYIITLKIELEEEAVEEGAVGLPAPFTEEDRKKRCPHQLYRDPLRFESFFFFFILILFILL
jgi:hypothetical protein